MRMSRLIGVVLILCLGNVGWAQESDPSSPENQPAGGQQPTDPDLAAVQVGAQAFVDAFNQADAAAVAALWTEQGEYVDASGATHVGRPAIEQAYAEYFADNPGAKMRLTIDDFKVLGETTAIEEGTTIVEVPPAALTVGRYLSVHIKVDGKWQMATVRDQAVEVSTAKQNLADLDWLVGTWVAEEHGNKHESVCRWLGDHSFVARDFTTTLVDGTQSSGVQLIGWNPQGGHIQSWTFSPDGGHAVGVWQPTENGWASRTIGMTGDGISTVASVFLRRLDDNAYVWQSVDRTAGDVAIPDTDEVVLKRQPDTK